MFCKKEQIICYTTGDKSLCRECTDQSLNMRTKWLQNPIFQTCFTFRRESFQSNITWMQASLFSLSTHLSAHASYRTFMKQAEVTWNIENTVTLHVRIYADLFRSHLRSGCFCTCVWYCKSMHANKCILGICVCAPPIHSSASAHLGFFETFVF